MKDDRIYLIHILECIRQWQFSFAQLHPVSRGPITSYANFFKRFCLDFNIIIPIINMNSVNTPAAGNS